MNGPRIRMSAAPAIVAFIALSAPPSVLTQSPGLKIVVVEGEDAVNIIQQKTAVAPIVEVRDRNDQPVAGAVVNFAIRGGRATFGGARTLAVTTDVAGRAVAAGFTPTASGAVQISATAAFQGQTAAAVTITQTTVQTAAQAAAVSSVGSSGGAASGAGAGAGGGSSGGATAGAGAGAGGGGGLSATTIGIIGGAVAGGAVVATQVAGDETPAGVQSYSGPLSLDWVVGCLVERMTATITVDFVASADTPETTVTNGRLEIRNGSGAVVSRPANCGVLGSNTWGMPGAPVTGTLSNFEAHAQDTVTSQIGLPLPRSYDFRGTLANGVLAGTFSMTWGGNLPQHPLSTGSAPVTLNRAQ